MNRDSDEGFEYSEHNVKFHWEQISSLLDHAGKVSLIHTDSSRIVTFNHIYQPLRLGRIWQKVNF